MKQALLGKLSLKSILLSFVLAITMVPGLSAGASKELNEVVVYLNQIDGYANYQSAASTAYNQNLNYNSKNRKAMYDKFNKVIVPNYAKYANGIKKIKPANKELGRLHNVLVQSVDKRLQGYTAMKNSLSKAPGDAKAFNKAKETLSSSQKLQNKFTEELGAYVEKLKLAEMAKAPTVKSLPLDYDANQAAEALIPQAWKLAVASAKALGSGNTAEGEKLLREWIASSNEELSLPGPDPSVNGFATYTAAYREQFDSELIGDWAKAMRATKMTDMSAGHSRKGSSEIQFAFKLSLKEYSETSHPVVEIVFFNTGERYEIKSVSIR